MSVEMAKKFHDCYEKLAPIFGYETREDTKEFDPLSNNGLLMTAVCAQVTFELRERIAELEDTCLSLETELASQVAANQILADMDAKTYAENQRLRAGLSEALDWNWLDDDAPDDSHLRALLGGGEDEQTGLRQQPTA